MDACTAVEREGEKVAKRLRTVGPEIDELLSSTEQHVTALKEELNRCKWLAMQCVLRDVYSCVSLYVRALFRTGITR